MEGWNRFDSIIEIINSKKKEDELTQVQCSIINFEQTQRKIFIDLINDRVGDYCNYLREFSLNKSINMTHLLLARMINHN